MKFSSKVEKCGLSPMRKFHPYAVAAKARGVNIYHLNIGQPDVQTPPAFFEAVRHFEQPVLAYAPSPGIPELIDAIQNYYDKLDMHFDKSEIYVTAGGSEALQIALQCILDDGDEILIPEPFYPNYNTMTRTSVHRFARSRPARRRGIATLSARRSNLSSTSTRAPSWSRIPATRPAWC